MEVHIQIVKNLLIKAKQSGKDPYLAMLESRNCPVENSSSPAQLIYGRCLRSLLPTYAKWQKQLKEGQDAYVYQNEKWKEAVVEKKCPEPLSYIMKTKDGKTYRRNRN